MRKDLLIMLIIAVVVVGAGVLLFVKYNPAKVSTPGQRPADTALLVRPTSHSLGPATAPVTIVEFGDYQCPACAGVQPAVQQMLNKYLPTNQVRFVYRFFPLTQIHKNAELSAEAVAAAGAQGKFWEMHDKLFATQNDWAESDNALDIFAGDAQNLGLNVDQFRNALTQHQYAQSVQADAADAATLELQGTPTFFVNNEQQAQIPGSLDAFSQLIDPLLKK